MKNILFILLFGCFPAFAQNDALFEEANRAYTEENFEEAANKYEQILQNGEASAELFYNLGNAHYKLEQVAPSIFYFEKALQLAPNDKDIRNNLAFAQDLRIDASPDPQTTGVDKLTEDVVSTFGLDAWGWAAIGFSVLFLVFFVLYYFSTSPKYKRAYFSVFILVFIFAGISFGLGYLRFSEIENTSYAIVFAEEVEVRNEPTARGNNIFYLHEGSKVEILENFQEWVKIALPDEKQGWVKQEQVKSL